MVIMIGHYQLANGIIIVGEVSASVDVDGRCVVPSGDIGDLNFGSLRASIYTIHDGQWPPLTHISAL